MLIGIHGPARSGKDTIARRLVTAHGFAQVSFASPIREFIANLTGLSLDHINDSDVKERPIHWLGGKSPRQMMQTLGTEWGRELVDPELWVKVAAQKIARLVGAGQSVVVSDVRFENEAAMVRDMGGTMLFVHRPDRPKQLVSPHVSESGIPFNLKDWTVRNDRDIGHLNDNVDLMVDALRGLRDAS